MWEQMLDYLFNSRPQKMIQSNNSHSYFNGMTMCDRGRKTRYLFNTVWCSHHGHCKSVAFQERLLLAPWIFNLGSWLFSGPSFTRLGIDSGSSKTRPIKKIVMGSERYKTLFVKNLIKLKMQK